MIVYCSSQKKRTIDDTPKTVRQCLKTNILPSLYHKNRKYSLSFGKSLNPTFSSSPHWFSGLNGFDFGTLHGVTNLIVAVELYFVNSKPMAPYRRLFCRIDWRVFFSIFIFTCYLTKIALNRLELGCYPFNLLLLNATVLTVFSAFIVNFVMVSWTWFQSNGLVKQITFLEFIECRVIFTSFFINRPHSWHEACRFII